MGGTRRLGTGGPEVGPVAFGAMSFAGYYGAADAEAGVRAVHRAIDLGITLIDTAEAYGGGSNEELVGRAIAGRRDAVVLATKASRGAPGYLRDAAEASLRRLGVDHIDVYYLHRVDADLAAGRAPALDGALACDGIDEFLDVVVQFRVRDRMTGTGETVHLHRTDGDG